jgi:hypothetical protein
LGGSTTTPTHRTNALPVVQGSHR